MSPRTLFLSRLIGLYCILVAMSMITRRQATLESVTALLHNPSMILILGVITLAAGLAMVLAHNIWSGGGLAVVVTLVGWITLIKSLLFLFLPPEVEAGFFLRQLHHQETFLSLRSCFTRPRRLPDLWRIHVSVTLASLSARLRSTAISLVRDEILLRLEGDLRAIGLRRERWERPPPRGPSAVVRSSGRGCARIPSHRR